MPMFQKVWEWLGLVWKCRGTLGEYFKLSRASQRYKTFIALRARKGIKNLEILVKLCSHHGSRLLLPGFRETLAAEGWAEAPTKPHR